MKKTSLITITSVFLLTLGLISTLWLDSTIGDRIVNIVTVVTAIIGAVALYVQFKKDKGINTASFFPHQTPAIQPATLKAT